VARARDPRLPTFALALAITTVTTYLPVVGSSFAASTVVIGVLIGGDGLLTLGLPVVVGTWSDRLRTRIGGRLPFVLGATPPLLAALSRSSATACSWRSRRRSPFVAAAAVTALAMAGFAVAIVRRGVPDQDYDDPGPPGETIRRAPPRRRRRAGAQVGDRPRRHPAHAGPARRGRLSRSGGPGRVD
jgi:hypothetical protein